MFLCVRVHLPPSIQHQHNSHVTPEFPLFGTILQDSSNEGLEKSPRWWRYLKPPHRFTAIITITSCFMSISVSTRPSLVCTGASLPSHPCFILHYTEQILLSMDNAYTNTCLKRPEILKNILKNIFKCETFDWLRTIKKSLHFKSCSIISEMMC